MADRPTGVAERAVSFDSFRLLPAQQLLLEGETPVRLGSRALEILTALVERAGELVSKAELVARVWPDTFVDENTLRVHVAGLRRALGDGQPGRRYLANVPGRGYRFVAPVEMSAPETSPAPGGAAAQRTHNLPLAQARPLGRASTISALVRQLPTQPLITIAGIGGIGKTTVAIAVAQAFLLDCEHDVWFVDLAPLNDPRLVPSTLAFTLGLAVEPENAVSRLIDFLRHRQILLVLDSCEHVIEAAAALAEQLLAGAPGLRIVATSREPLRAEGERVHRLSPLDVPVSSTGLTASEALAFSSVQLFVERASGSVDDFRLNDGDAPIVADICRKLGGVALAVELAAARIDAFGVRQLSALLDDRFRILNQGRRTAQARHRSLTATLDWSYEFLPEAERIVLRRLAVFVGGFTLDLAVAVAGDGDIDVVEGVANLVAKSLISADVGHSVVWYRLLDTTRAYAMQKLTASGELDAYLRRHAHCHRDLLTRAEAEWLSGSATDWRQDYGLRLDDVRSALNWAFSPGGDASLGVALTAASIALWFELSLMTECCDQIERALASKAGGGRDEMRLLGALAAAQQNAKGPVAHIFGLWTRALEIAESLGDEDWQVRILSGMAVNRLLVGDYRGTLPLTEKIAGLASRRKDAVLGVMGDCMAASALHFLGDYAASRRHLDYLNFQSAGQNKYLLLAYRVTGLSTLSYILWIQGFPDQAVRGAQAALDEARVIDNALMLCSALGHAVCPIALAVGDLDRADGLVATLLDSSTKNSVVTWNAQGRCLKGALLLAQGDAAGLPLLQSGVDWLRAANFAFLYINYLGSLAQALGAAGKTAEAHAAINEALERSDRNDERWCAPELLRIKGELVRLEGTEEAHRTARDCFLQALEWSRRQGALSWELRAATSLARLWHQNHKTVEAGELLSAVYDRFTEGFETVDLRTARALIEELRSPSP